MLAVFNRLPAIAYVVGLKLGGLNYRAGALAAVEHQYGYVRNPIRNRSSLNDTSCTFL